MRSPLKINYKDYLKNEQIIHSPYEQELAYFESVKNGNIDFLKKHPARLISGQEGLGMLSASPLKNQLYHFIIGTSISARFCIEGGLELDSAYTLSDYYIRTADKMDNAEDIAALYQTMVLDFAGRMQTLNRRQAYAKPIVQSFDYIYNHLHEKIKVTDIAEHVKLNPSYLSKLFKQECGISISGYICEQRLKAAENMLKYSDYTYSEIASALMFASQSYFIKVFREKTGLTPKEYRNRFYRKRFTDEQLSK